jgi:Tfp pilus assembly pilus retraction ATPase PilT
MISYRTGNNLDLDQVIELYRASTLGQRRPIGDRARMELMLRNANLVITADSKSMVYGGTMPTLTATETIMRLIDFYPPHQHKQARYLLASSLRAVICQRLLERADGKGRTAAVEVLVNTPKVYDCILDADRQSALERILAEGEYHGMQTFDQALFALFKDGMVSLRDALSVASQPEDLRIALQQAGLAPAY